MDKLNAICEGWTIRGTIIMNPHPRGGIIDQNLSGFGWFIIFNDDRVDETWYQSLDEAIDAFCNFSVDN